MTIYSRLVFSLNKGKIPGGEVRDYNDKNNDFFWNRHVYNLI